MVLYGWIVLQNFFLQAELQFARVRHLIRGKPYERHVISPFYAVGCDENDDTQVCNVDYLFVSRVAITLLTLKPFVSFF